MKLKSLFAAMLAMATLVSCNNDDRKDDSKITGVEGLPTVARLTLSQSGITRATESATADESEIKTATIYIFKNDGILEKAIAFGAADITAGNKVFAITSGAKFIYAVVNIPTGQLTGITENATTRTTFEEKILTINAIADATTISGDGYWMGNTTGAVSSTLAAGITESDAAAGINNNVTIPVGRTTAKVTVSSSPSINVIGGTFLLTGYKVANNAKKNYLMPIIVNGINETPNFNEGAVVPADYFNETNFQTSLTIGTYATENTHANPMFGNSSTVVIKAVFSPTTLLDGSGVVSSTVPSTSTFFRIQKSDLSFTADYYIEAPTAAEIAAKTGSDVGALPVEYTNGVCYYRLLIADNSQTTASKKYAVIRNNFYKISIVNVNGAGSNTEAGIEPGQPGQPDIDNPVEETTNMKATISILPWNVIEQNGGI